VTNIAVVRIYLICGQRGMVVVRSQERKDCLYVCGATHKGRGSELASGSRSQIAGLEDMRDIMPKLEGSHMRRHTQRPEGFVSTTATDLIWKYSRMSS
jgi:hypothetical protein